MGYDLTNEEKISIIDQHIKNLKYSKFNTEMSLVEESAGSNPKQSLIDDLNKQISEIDSKINSLLNELDKVV
jgi:hypothetical protein